MTPNDKLPEEILKQIDNESNQRLARQKELAESECDLAYAQGEAEGYATGATEWARWKVKHDELQAQAQRMADALEWIKTYGPADDITVKFVNKALREFKDGKGKESVVGKCVKCGRHYTHANESGICNKCEKEGGGE